MSSASLLKMKRCNFGFTLIELVIAITIGAMVMGILVYSLSITLKTWEKAKKPPDTAIDSLLDLLATQIIHASKDIPEKFIFRGKSNLLAFTTNFSVMGLSMNTEVLACYKYDEQGKKLLYRQEIITRGEEEKLNKFIGECFDFTSEDKGWTVILPAENFRITYWHSQDRLDQWEDLKTPPGRILVEASREGKAIARLIYPDIKSILNSHQSKIEK